MDDEISQLPDELLLKVLLFLPTKVAVSTSILSKRWEFLWMWLPKLEYSDSSESKSWRLSPFVDLNLPLHKAPVIESLRLNFDAYNRDIVNGINNWVLTAVSRCVRELRVTLAFTHYKLARVPSNLFTCKSLVILELTGDFYVNVPRMVFLPSLKFLILRRMWYSDLHKLLSHCPVLEDLLVEPNDDDKNTLSVIVPSLQRLTLKIPRGYHIEGGYHFEGLVINTPSLKYFKIMDYIDEYKLEDSSYSYYFEDTPKLEEADIESTYPDINKFVRSIRSVKRLSLCIRVNADEEVTCFHPSINLNILEHQTRFS